MIANDYFTYWLEGIVFSARLIADPGTLANVWIDRKTNITSAYSCDELLEQLLGDLHLQRHANVFADDLRKLNALEDVISLTHALLDVDTIVRSDSSLESPENLLASMQWKNLQTVAKRVSESATINAFLK